MAVETDLQSGIFRTSEAPSPCLWRWIGSYGIPSCIAHRPYLHTKFHWNGENFWWTDGHFPSNVIRLIQRSRPNNKSTLSRIKKWTTTHNKHKN